MQGGHVNIGGAKIFWGGTWPPFPLCIPSVHSELEEQLDPFVHRFFTHFCFLFVFVSIFFNLNQKIVLPKPWTLEILYIFFFPFPIHFQSLVLELKVENEMDFPDFFSKQKQSRKECFPDFVEGFRNFPESGNMFLKCIWKEQKVSNNGLLSISPLNDNQSTPSFVVTSDTSRAFQKGFIWYLGMRGCDFRRLFPEREPKGEL